jgi:hypothetical protein
MHFVWRFNRSNNTMLQKSGATSRDLGLAVKPIVICNEPMGDVLLTVAFIARAARFFHYAIAIALSTSDDMLKSFCASARPTQVVLIMARLTRWQN